MTLTLLSPFPSVRVDATPPLAGMVSDGNSPDVDLRYSSSFTTIQASWTGFWDYESGIAQYVINVFRQAPGEPAPVQVYSETIPGSEDRLTRNRFQFGDGDYVFVEVVGVNGAGGFVSVNSSGVIIDLSPAQLVAVVDGNDLLSDLQYQPFNDTLSVTWIASDAESGIEHIFGSVYELREGRRSRVYPEIGRYGVMIPVNQTSWTVSGLDLNSGARYVTSLTFVNGAGLEIMHETNGVIVDPTPPTIVSVSVLSDSYLDTDDMGEMVVMVADPNQTEARWLALDSESGIQHYMVGVADANGTLISSGYTTFAGTVTGGLIQTAGLLAPNTLYRVAVVAVNNAGGLSETAFSEPYRYVYIARS